MNGAWVVALSEFRRRLPALLGLALIVALVVAVVLATAAGARRTSTAVDRFVTETGARNFMLWDR